MYRPLYIGGELASISAAGKGIPLSADNADYQAFFRWLKDQHKTLEQWLSDNPDPEPQADRDRAAKLAALTATDAGVIRGVDDLWALLVSKGVIRAEDVPPLLKAKLDARAALRADISAVAAVPVPKD